VAASCGLVHELLAATLASYVLGNSVRQYTLVIGAYLAAMGLGAFVSRRVPDNALGRGFVAAELALALVGGFSAPVLYLCIDTPERFRAALYALALAAGALVGAELPLLMRVLQRDMSFRELVSRALVADHAGSLVASWVFPWLLVPWVGLLRASMLAGLCNALVALWCIRALRAELAPHPLRWTTAGLGVFSVLAFALARAPHLERWLEARGVV
jgi:spermidine synthase